MSVLRRLVKADARRLRVVLLFWVLLVAATAVSEGVRPFVASNARLLAPFDVAAGLLWLAKSALMVLLVSFVLHAHPAVGSTAFWMTRPFPPRLLALSKVVLLVAATVALLAVADFVLMAAYRVPTGTAMAVAIHDGLSRALLVAMLMAAASITPNLSRYLLLCGAAVVTVAVLVSILFAFMTARFDEMPRPSTGEDVGDPTGGLVALGLTIGAGLGVVFAQYSTRSRVRSVSLGAAGLCLAWLAESLWPWAFMARAAPLPAWALEESSLRLKAALESVEVSREQGFPGREAAWRGVRARVRLAEPPAGWSVDASVLRATLRIDGATLISGGVGQTALPLDTGEEFPAREVARRLLGVSRIAEAVPPRGESPVVLFVTEDDLNRHANRVGEYEGRLQLGLTRHEIESVLPLRPETRHDGGSFKLVVDRVVSSGATVLVFVRESNAASMFDGKPESTYRFYLRNTARGEAVAGVDMGRHAVSFLWRLLPFDTYVAGSADGFRARLLSVRFPDYGPWDKEKAPELDDDWLSGADLVIVRATRLGTVERQLHIAEFPLRRP